MGVVVSILLGAIVEQCLLNVKVWGLLYVSGNNCTLCQPQWYFCDGKQKNQWHVNSADSERNDICSHTGIWWMLDLLHKVVLFCSWTLRTVSESTNCCEAFFLIPVVFPTSIIHLNAPPYPKLMINHPPTSPIKITPLTTIASPPSPPQPHVSRVPENTFKWSRSKRLGRTWCLSVYDPLGEPPGYWTACFWWQMAAGTDGGGRCLPVLLVDR